ncbi:MAG: hypothetical protein COY66_02480 [Candidatus Kerfeldbacteria bacterium CG_4_10_14_0_8_um_filter_42_10]|uniref:Uncharacterized protein n=1 Tax=Candidatus Kerfeldbacteria bacterium CG_4_10_14_0_8_um_filter_42_10 TaxID=2014248 RepID=A0A2M7RJE2_9BACT|nr:MAG: hypothetical protein COY66_02480 [Candidatus Kerfeldbacteria bacterium CG_4_10_14_0_8_um_filter_42_10]
MVNFDMPPRASEEEEKFEIKPKPEIPEGGRENKIDAENGQPLKYEVLDEGEHVTYREERWYQKDQVPSPETMGGHRQQFFQYDDQGRVTEEFGQTLSTEEGDPKHENQWRNTHQYPEDGGHILKGVIEHGKDKGHEWQTTTTEQPLGENGKVVIETNEILEQGQNLEKPEKGTIFEKRKYFDSAGVWVGNENIDHQTGEITHNFPKDATELPEWANV